MKQAINREKLFFDEKNIVGESVMTEKMLLNQIKTYESNVERNRRYAEYYNAEFEQTGSHNAYYISRNFYRELEHSQKMLDEYRSMVKNGIYSDSEVYGN